MSSGYIINSEGKYFERFKIEAQNNGWIVRFQISGKQPAKIVDANAYLFHRISKTNKILGCSQIEEIGSVIKPSYQDVWNRKTRIKKPV